MEERRREKKRRAYELECFAQTPGDAARLTRLDRARRTRERQRERDGQREREPHAEWRLAYAARAGR